MPFHVAKMADSRLDHIDLTKYTTVSDDKKLLRSLLDIHFHFEFPFNSFSHIDLVLEDMVHGQERYSSPVHVNVILASAWVFPDGFDAKTL
jgi:hypothetical protein